MSEHGLEPGIAESTARGSNARRHDAEAPRHAYGWFGPLLSREVPRDRPTSFEFMGHELVAFRDASGRAVVLDAHCPHFGAHLGHGGEVVGGRLRCPFHRLDFDGNGRCVGAATYYDGTRVGHLRARTWACEERLGVIFVWHGADPTRTAWPLPIDERAWDGWTTPVTNAGLRVANMNPMWFSENIADIAHIGAVHCWDDVRVLRQPSEAEDGAFELVADVTWRLGARSRDARLHPLGRWINSPFRLHARVLNPGISVAEATLTEAQGSMRVRNLVLVRPVGERDTHLRVVTSVRRQFEGRVASAVRRALGKGIEDAIARYMLFVGTDDFQSDAAIWRWRKHLESPVALRGDKPLLEFRKWSTRFWPDEHAASDASRLVSLRVPSGSASR